MALQTDSTAALAGDAARQLPDLALPVDGGHYMIQPLVELCEGCMVVLKVS